MDEMHINHTDTAKTAVIESAALIVTIKDLTVQMYALHITPTQIFALRDQIKAAKARLAEIEAA